MPATTWPESVLLEQIGYHVKGIKKTPTSNEFEWTSVEPVAASGDMEEITEFSVQILRAVFQHGNRVLPKIHERILNSISTVPSGVKIDNKDRLTSHLEEMEKGLKAICRETNTALRNINLLRRNNQIAFLLQEIHDLNSRYVTLFQKLRWEIMIHDAELEEKLNLRNAGRTFSGSQEFKQLLKK